MIFLFIIISYAGLMILAGVIAARRVRGSGDFFVAGRNLRAGLLFSTLLAANIGAGSTVGATGLGWRNGLSAWWWVGSAGIGSMILAFTIGPKIWRVAQQHNLYTVGDYLEFRYHRTVRGLAALLLWCGSLAILAGQLIAVAWILNVTAGINKAVGCVIGATVATVYFASGGLFGTARVNALQLLIKLIGFGLALVYLYEQYQQHSLLVTLFCDTCAPRTPETQTFNSLTGIGPTAIWHYLAILVPSFIISPGLLQKIFGARDQRSVRLGVALNACCLLLFAFVPAVLGMIAKGYFGGLDNQELALPLLLTERLPVWLGGLLLGAIFAAEISTADAVLFMLSTSLSKDLYQSFLKPQATDQEMMRVARITAIACGVAGALLGILLPSVISALTIFYTLLTAALLLPVIVGLYSANATTRDALATMTVSITVTFLCWLLAGKSDGWHIPPVIFGLAAGVLALLISRMSQRQSERRSAPV